MKIVSISTEYITLGQFLKLADLIDTGGAAKWFLQEYEVHVNSEEDNRRGRKLFSGDVVNIPAFGSFQVKG
jgi:S4 domain protein YaaA